MLRLEQTDNGAKNKKSNIDKLDEYVIELRNKYKLTAILISQFNRDISDITRQKIKEVRPQLEDFKETSATSDGADIVIAPFNPSRYDIANYKNYNLNGKHAKHIRFIWILKNRGGVDNVYIPTRMLGECGYFEELPVKPPEESEEFYLSICDFTKKIKEYK